ncbi:ATP-binding protein [Haliangium sp.]|uniref:ATP-binding protein n=1 Tax=Haliangium sp. TaxID=2663208 RepID=UPI003D0E6578
MSTSAASSDTTPAAAVPDYALLAQELATLTRWLEPADGEANTAPGAASDRESGTPPAGGHESPGSSPVVSPVHYPVLGRIAARFGLSRFERAILLAAAGLELDSGFAAALARALGDGMGPALTFGLALARFPDPHWSALTPSGPLRRHRLIRLGDGHGLVARSLHIEERVLHAIAGLDGWDPLLERRSREVLPPRHLAPSHRDLADIIVRLWTADPARVGVIPMLCGRDARTRRDIAAAACAMLGLRLCAIDIDVLPAQAEGRDELARRCGRDAVLAHSGVFVEATQARDALRFSERLDAPVILSCDAPIQTRHRASERPLVRIDVHPPTAEEQTALWQSALGPRSAEYRDAVADAVAHFRLDADEIHNVAAALAGVHAGVEADADADDTSEQNPGATSDAVVERADALWQGCRTQSRPRLDGLAERISSRARWSDLVLPRDTLVTLRAIVAQVRQRDEVYQRWGYDRTGPRGLGVSALFSGPSGTGKTLAAEVVANELGLDLYRIDLSGVVSKYIGETEKNLQQVFDAAESGGVVLLFDEADALFGKRSEVKDARDRYANIEVSYLLQRMESYRGLAVLTSNLRAALDTAFLRRLRFAIEFPFPETAQRVELWRRAFPDTAPTQGLDIDRLATIQLCGGNIRNISLNAAFLAADAGQPITMDHVIDAARAEFVKLERPFAGLTRPKAAGPNPVQQGANR